MTTFFERLDRIQSASNSLLCIGLDPDPARLPAAVRSAAHPVFAFNKAIIDATADLVCCYKPQLAHYSAMAAERDLELTIDYIHEHELPVVLDGKRGDIGSTAERYAIELFERYKADATTLNPYLGLDSLAPYLDYADRGCFILCRTSNPGGADVQNLRLDTGEQVYEHIAHQAATCWNARHNVGLVVGATRPAEIERIRQLTAGMTLLVPGIGAQGGDVAETMAAGEGGGMVINSSRQVIYAFEEGESDFAAAIRRTAIATRDEINRYRTAAA